VIITVGIAASPFIQFPKAVVLRAKNVFTEVVFIPNGQKKQAGCHYNGLQNLRAWDALRADENRRYCN